MILVHSSSKHWKNSRCLCLWKTVKVRLQHWTVISPWEWACQVRRWGLTEENMSLGHLLWTTSHLHPVLYPPFLCVLMFMLPPTPTAEWWTELWTCGLEQALPLGCLHLSLQPWKRNNTGRCLLPASDASEFEVRLWETFYHPLLYNYC